MSVILIGRSLDTALRLQLSALTQVVVSEIEFSTMASYELKNRANSANREVTGSDSGARDDLALARLGKKAVLKVCPSFSILCCGFGETNACLVLLQRNFGILSIIGLSCTILGTWEGILS